MHRLATLTVRWATGVACAVCVILMSAGHAHAQPTIDWRAERAEAGVLGEKLVIAFDDGTQRTLLARFCEEE